MWIMAMYAVVYYLYSTPPNVYNPSSLSKLGFQQHIPSLVGHNLTSPAALKEELTVLLECIDTIVSALAFHQVCNFALATSHRATNYLCS